MLNQPVRWFKTLKDCPASIVRITLELVLGSTRIFTRLVVKTQLSTYGCFSMVGAGCLVIDEAELCIKPSGCAVVSPELDAFCVAEGVSGFGGDLVSSVPKT